MSVGLLSLKHEFRTTPTQNYTALEFLWQGAESAAVPIQLKMKRIAAILHRTSPYIRA
ncbi:hypothetical protein [Zobellia amurskyensis]|uniref:hypothetical protein n=1 Tax=Zobellia amurskyensis TaxID=248905 RepID=UPI001411D4D2|nr:hypothetical protein [Zobellia amurskyensis]